MVIVIGFLLDAHQELFHEISQFLPLVSLFLVSLAVSYLGVSELSLILYIVGHKITKEKFPQIKLAVQRPVFKNLFSKCFKHDVCQQSYQCETILRKIHSLLRLKTNKVCSFSNFVFQKCPHQYFTHHETSYQQKIYSRPCFNGYRIILISFWQ